MPLPDVRDRLMYLLKTPGGLTFRRVPGNNEAALRDVAFQLHVMLGLGDEPGNNIIEALEEWDVGGVLIIEHDDAKDETRLEWHS